MDKEVAVLVVPVERPHRSKGRITAAPWGMRRSVVVPQYCFNTDMYRTGEVVEMSHHEGEVSKGLIAECTKDYMKVYIVDKMGEPLMREIELEEYIAGTWIIKLL